MDEWLPGRWSSDMERYINHLIHEVNELHRFQMSVEHDKQIQAVLELMGRIQASHVSYTNLIIVAGYAAFFTFWSTLKNDLPGWLYAISGLLIVLSLLIFIAWEVTKMIWSAVSLRNIERRLTSRPPEADVIFKFQQEINAFERRINRLWIWFLVPTVTLGLASGLCLVAFFAWKLLVALT
jgi:hypothetical protein